MTSPSRRLLITGATGIAAAAARRHVAAGGEVFVISIDAAECEALTAEVEAAGGRCGWTAADLRDEAATVAAVAQAHAGWGRIDGLLAVAGGSGRKFGDGPLHEISLDGWRQTLELNLQTSFLTVREGLRAMLDQDRDPRGSRGAIVVVSSVLAYSPAPTHFSTHAYAAAKAAQLGMVTAAAARYAPDGIRVNAVAPGLTDTPMASRAAANPVIQDFAAAKQPLAGGFVSADDVAAAGLFLLSPSAGAVTGQVLAVDGGWSVGDAGG